MKQKKLLLLIIGFFLLQMQTNLQAQEYVPFPDSNVVWKIYWLNYPPDEPWTAMHYDYIPSGDTLINDTQYQKLFKVDYDLYCSDIADTIYIGAYRNDIPNKIVYFYQGGEEKILYDFSLGVGDTISKITSFVWMEADMFVGKIDTIELKTGEYRRQFWYYLVTYPTMCHSKVVEGIGNLRGLLEPISTAAELINSILLCYHDNDTLLYIDQLFGFDKCEAPEDTCIITKVEKIIFPDNIIEIVPNPVRSTAVIHFANPQQIKNSYSLTLYNLFGEEIISYPNIKHGETIINSNMFKVGIYIYILKQNDIIVQTGKIMINP